MSTQHIFEIADSTILQKYIGHSTILAIDETQSIPKIEQTLKLIK
jgi:hypothetical protein